MISLLTPCRRSRTICNMWIRFFGAFEGYIERGDAVEVQIVIHDASNLSTHSAPALAGSTQPLDYGAVMARPSVCALGRGCGRGAAAHSRRAGDRYIRRTGMARR